MINSPQLIILVKWKRFCSRFSFILWLNSVTCGLFCKKCSRWLKVWQHWSRRWGFSETDLINQFVQSLKNLFCSILSSVWWSLILNARNLSKLEMMKAENVANGSMTVTSLPLWPSLMMYKVKNKSGKMFYEDAGVEPGQVSFPSTLFCWTVDTMPWPGSGAVGEFLQV